MLGALLSGLASPLGSALGGALLGGLGAPSASSNQVAARPVERYSGVGGTATEGGFTWQPNAQTATNTGYANSQLGNVLQSGIAYDPAQAGQYQQAYLNARLPALQQAQNQQANTQAANLSATGMAGSSGAMYQDALRQQMANQQLSELQNQAVLGGQQLAQQDLQNKINSGTFLNQLTQQDFTNALNAQQAAAGNRLNSQVGNINLANQGNQAGLLNAEQANTLSQQRLSNIFGGANAGMNLYNGIYGNQPSNPTVGGVQAVNTGTQSVMPNSITNAFRF